MESDNQAQRSMVLRKRSFSDWTINSHITEKKQRKDEMEDKEHMAGASPANCLSDSYPDTKESGTQDMWLQEIQKSQGDYELEVTSGDEVDLYKCFNGCTKNPGHKQFIDVNTFRSEHLPEHYQSDQKLTDLVRVQADLTCLIKVSYVSPDRPETLPFYKYRDRRDFSRSGTGWVWGVEVYTKEDKGERWYSPCGCHTCQQSGEPRSDWAEVRIGTAKHVVFDEREAEACKCYFFYDNPQQKQTDCPALTGTYVGWVFSSSAGDVSVLVYYTHDVVLARKLKDMYDHYYSLCVDLSRKYAEDNYMNKDDNTQVQNFICKNKDNYTTGRVVQDLLSNGEDCGQENSDDEKDDDDDDWYNAKHNLTIITSHPHGCSKMVTLGYIDRRLKPQGYTRYYYNTATCPGSSGAPVYVLGRRFGLTFHSHSGHFRGQGPEQINRSGICLL